MAGNVVVGIDGGGTKTEVLVTAIDGTVLGSAETGGASTDHNHPETARRNLREGLRAALDDAGRSPGNVAAFTAGVAGLNTPSDYDEVEGFLDIDAVPCEGRVVNDSVVAHLGALRGDPGVVAVCGTGSIILGMTAEGRQVRNYECLHYARAAARHLGERALHALLGGAAPGEWVLGDELVDCWDCDSVTDLRTTVRDDDRFDDSSSGNPLDRVAPLITAAAADGDPTARAICDDAIAEVVTGIRVVGGFIDDPVAVATAGSVLGSEYATNYLRRHLEDEPGFRYVEAALSPVAGAAYDAIGRIGDADEEVVRRLRAGPADGG